MARRKLVRSPAPPPEPESDNAGAIGAGLLGALGLGAGALLLRKPQLAKKAAGTLANSRLASLLSGYALPKSIGGNVGAAAVASLEHGTTAPLRQLFSRQTLRDIGQQIRKPSGYGQYEPAPWWSPARYMSAADWATSHAIERGLPHVPDAAKEAQRVLLQTPLDPRAASALESGPAKYLIPFRRTPTNQFYEGLETLKGKHPKILAGSIGAGVLAGENIDNPYTLALTTPLASTYSLPYISAAAITRFLRGKRPGDALRGVTPFSEYGIEQSLTHPLEPFTQPAIKRVWRRLRRGD